AYSRCDPTHAPTAPPTPITATPPSTSTTIRCPPNSIFTGSTSNCTATVTDTSPAPTTTPTGTVTFSVSGTGSGTFSSPTCTLASGSCSVTFTGTTVGTATVRGNYGGDSIHTTSFGTATVTVNALHTTSTTI